MSNKNHVFGVIEDLVSDFLYYDRKEDDTLELGMIDDMVKNGEITIDEMVEQFRKSLTEGIQ